MSRKERIVHTWTCDGNCGLVEETSDAQLPNGWTSKGGYDYCPKCAADKKKTNRNLGTPDDWEPV